METVVYTPIGNIKIIASSDRVESITFVDEPHTQGGPNSPVLKMAKQELDEYFAGQRATFTMPVQLYGTEFQLKVWGALRHIPFGQTISYHELAVTLGDPNCIRAAASANGKNPLAIVVPCHRVIGSNGELTGYAGGLDKKKGLLRHEGVINQLDLFEL
jgi:methylated-DNA-[protein]-cysteine S-methyltransferase